MLLLVLAIDGCGHHDSARVRTFAQLPNWNGIWIADDGIMPNLALSGFTEKGIDRSKLVLGGKTPFRPEWEPKVAAFRAAYTNTGKECAFYFPQVMESPWMFQFLITPEETALIFGGREVRHIYTDGRKHLDEDSIWATPWGDSIGHWEGDTLVVDTIAVQPARIPLGPLLSEKAHFTERIRMPAPGRIEDQLTIEDPVALTKAWTVTVPYKLTALDRLMHGDCQENDRNPVVDGKLTITPAAH
jgi:hypothetical protein